MTHRLLPTACSLIALCALSAQADDAAVEAIDWGKYYGFAELEIYKLDQRVHSLANGDFDGDGRMDLVVADNGRSRLAVFRQRSEDAPDPAKTSDPNQLRNPMRLDEESVMTEREVAALAVADFTADGNEDVAYFGLPDQLVIRSRKGRADWPTVQRFRLPDVNPQPFSMVAGDLNADDRADLVILGSEQTFVLFQNDEGTLDSPKQFGNTTPSIGLAQIADVNDDGFDDLCYFGGEEADRFVCVRLQQAGGQLGPEMRFSLDRVRGVTVADVAGTSAAEILSIDAQTNRAAVARLVQEEVPENELGGRLQFYGIGQNSRSRTQSLAVGDVDGNGLQDVVFATESRAEVILFRQNEDGLQAAQSFASYLGIEQVVLADFNGDGRDEVLLRSSREGRIGISQWKDDRLTFPTFVPGEIGTSYVLVTDVTGDDTADLVLRRGSSSNAKPAACRVEISDDGKITYEFLEDVSFPDDFTGEKLRLYEFHTAEEEKRGLLLVAESRRATRILIAESPQNWKWDESNAGTGLGELRSDSIFPVPGSDTEFCVVDGAFVRHVRLTKDLSWDVLHQVTAKESGSRFTGAGVLQFDGSGAREMIVVDAGTSLLRIFSLEEGQATPRGTIELDRIRGGESISVGDFNGDDRDDLLIGMEGSFVVVSAAAEQPTLETLATYESDEENTFMLDLISGDLNNDGQPDIVLSDTRENRIEILHVTPDAQLTRALEFGLFESKSFTRPDSAGRQPRQMLIADVTDDGRNDLVMLCHDRMLIYIQDSPGSPTDEEE